MIVTCQYCQNQFYNSSSKTSKFCSRKCYYKYLKYRPPQAHHNWRGGKVTLKFINCGQTFQDDPHRAQRAKYCSYTCKFSYSNKLEKNANWRGGISFEPYGLAFNSVLKEQIRKRDNHTCQRCFKTKEQLGYSPPVHHIDYNKKNNHPSNLITVCRSCNARANFNRPFWQELYLVFNTPINWNRILNN